MVSKSIKQITIVLALVGLFTNTFAYIDAYGLTVSRVNMVSDPNFHGMAGYGVTGNVCWIDLPAGSYSVHNGEAGNVDRKLIIDGEDNNVKKTWIAMLVTARSTGQRISFHAVDIGGGNMRLYYLALQD